MWQHHISALQDDFHCITVDLSGHGDSSSIEWTSFENVVSMLVPITEKKAHEKPHLVGLALGASVSLKKMEKHRLMLGEYFANDFKMGH